MDDRRQLWVKSYTMYLLVVVLMIAVVARVVNIQYGDVVPETPLAADADRGATTKVDSVPPMRGRLLADDGSDLVTSIPLYDLHLDMAVMDASLFAQIPTLAQRLAVVFDERSPAEWEDYLRKGRTQRHRYLLIQRNVKHTTLQQVKQFPLFNTSPYRGGGIVERHYKRQKPNGLLASRTLGYKRRGARPVGLEGGFDTFLTGTHGLRAKQWVNGSWKPVNADNLKDPVQGADVVTSIDVSIQEVAQNELMRQLKLQDAAHGSVIVMQVQTGFVKAIANLTRGRDGNYYETYNHAIGTRTEPGSTFKLAALMALLEDRKITIADRVDAHGAYRFYDHTINDSRTGGYGTISIKRAFEVSSNVFSEIIHRAYYRDAQQFVDRLKSFGLAEPLGLSIAGEPHPLIKDRGEHNWSGITLPQMAIGYEVEVTPLQLLAFYNAVANEGQLIKPQFVREIRQNGTVVQTYQKAVLKEKICSDNTLESVRKCLEGVVENGTGTIMQSANLKIAGKTGTARIVQTNQGYGDDHQASFVGYFPADHPAYSCIVTIAGPTKQIYGAQVSGTVFTAIADKVYSSSMKYHQNLQDKERCPTAALPHVKCGHAAATKTALRSLQLPFDDRSGGADWVEQRPGARILALQQRRQLPSTVPNVEGMPLNDALFLLENAGLNVSVKGRGSVTAQSQEPGKTLIKGTTIHLVLDR